MKCGSCGYDIVGFQRFCTACGQPLGIKVPFLGLNQSQRGQDPALYIEALDHYQRREYAQAERAIFELLLKFPTNPKYHNFLGSVCLKTEKLNLAKLHFKKAIELDNELWEPFYNTGIIFYRQQEIRRAKQCFMRSFQINEKHFRSLYNLGTIYLKEGKYQEAVAAFRRVRELAPDYTKNNINLEVALKKLN